MRKVIAYDSDSESTIRSFSSSIRTSGSSLWTFTIGNSSNSWMQWCVMECLRLLNVSLSKTHTPEKLTIRIESGYDMKE